MARPDRWATFTSNDNDRLAHLPGLGCPVAVIAVPLIIVAWGWAPVPVSIAHTVVLLWVSWATMEIISSMEPLQASQKVVGIVVLSAAWMLVTGPVWR